MNAPVDEVAAKELSVLRPRQREVLILLGKGMSHKEIAARLAISINTVREHVSQLHRTLKMTTIEMVVLACKAGWL